MKSSLLLATFNGEKYIKEQLDSIRCQTKLPDEVIICDDCSNDDTKIIILQYIEDNQLNATWKFVENTVNVGFRNNFLKLMSLANYQVIFLSDQDDIWESNKIELMMRSHEIISNPAVIVSDVNQLVERKSRGEKIVSEPIADKIIFDKNNDLYQILLTQNNLKNRRPGWSFSFSKEFIPDIVNLFELSNSIFHDEAIWYVGIIQDRLFYLNRITGDWRKFSGSETTRSLSLSNLRNNNKNYFNHSISNLEILTKLQMNEKYTIIIKNEINLLKIRKNVIVNGSFFKGVQRLLRGDRIKESLIDVIKCILIRFAH